MDAADMAYDLGYSTGREDASDFMYREMRWRVMFAAVACTTLGFVAGVVVAILVL